MSEKSQFRALRILLQYLILIFMIIIFLHIFLLLDTSVSSSRIESVDDDLFSAFYFSSAKGASLLKT